MRRVRWYHFLIMLLVIPRPSPALQLRWSSGATNLTFAFAVRCTLVVQADSAQALPSQWQLLWAADSSAVQFVALDSTLACLADTAKVDSIAPPATPADSAANEITARFCSGGSGAAATACYLLDLVGGSHGKLKAVALNPADSTSVIESNEVTYNAGVEGDYPTVVLCASSVHQSLRLQVTEIGSGLAAANSMSIMAKDSSWTLPLMITAQTDHSVTGVASVAALLPACLATVGSVSATASTATLAADPEIQLDIPETGGCTVSFVENLLTPPPVPLGYALQPRDFAFTPGFVDMATNRYAMHLFYTRHNYWYYQPPDDQTKWHPEFDEKRLGHVWSSDFVSWHAPCRPSSPCTPCNDIADTCALEVRPGMFDEFHVWAPTIVHPPGPTYYMFYTGVQKDLSGRENQRIGVARSTDLDNWTQADAPVLSVPQIPWANTNPSHTFGGSQQLRDPFVMEYPIGSGQYIMYFVSVDSRTDTLEDMAVGAARSTDLLNWDPLARPFAATERPTFQGHTHIVESDQPGAVVECRAGASG